MMEEKKQNTLTRLGTLGGKIGFRKDKAWIYGLDGENPNMSKEALFGKAGRGPLHPGIPYRHEVALESVESDTPTQLVKELMDKGLTREEAVETIKELLKEGILVEVYDPNLKGKVLRFGGKK